MAMIKCSECGKDISDKANVCIGCGAPLVCAVHSESTKLSPSNVNSEKTKSEWTEKLIEICGGFSGTSYFALDSIPEKKINNSMKAYPLPNGGRVIALIDSTVFGSASDGLAIGQYGLSWHNSFEMSKQMDWEAFAGAEIIAKDKTNIYFDETNKFSVIGFDINVAVKLLKTIQQAVIQYSGALEFSPAATNSGSNINSGAENGSSLEGDKTVLDGFAAEMQRELEACQKEFSGDDKFIVNRDLFLKCFFDSETQGSLATKGSNAAINLAGAAGGVAAATAIFSSTTSGFMLLLGATTPIGWLAGGAAAGFMLMKALNKGKASLESKVYDKTAKYISCPMDQVARGLCQLSMPVAIAAARSDGNYDGVERKIIVDHFVLSWGLNSKAVNEMMEEFEAVSPDEWDSLELANTIKRSIEEMTKGAVGIDQNSLGKKVCAGVVKLALEIVESDGVVTRSETRFMKRLAADLGVPELVTGL